MAKKEEKLSATNYRTTKICKQLPLSDQPFYVSKTILSFRHCEKFLSHFLNSWNGVRDTDELVLIRIVLMNPFFSSKETSTDFISAFITGNNALFDMN